MEQLNKLNVPSLKTIAKEKGIRLRTNSRKAEIIQQILESGVEFNAQDLDRGMKPSVDQLLSKVSGKSWINTAYLTYREKPPMT